MSVIRMYRGPTASTSPDSVAPYCNDVARQNFKRVLMLPRGDSSSHESHACRYSSSRSINLSFSAISASIRAVCSSRKLAMRVCSEAFGSAKGRLPISVAVTASNVEPVACVRSTGPIACSNHTVKRGTMGVCATMAATPRPIPISWSATLSAPTGALTERRVEPIGALFGAESQYLSGNGLV